MRAGHLTVVSGQHDDGVIGQAAGFKPEQHLLDTLVNVAHAVQVVTLQALPGSLITRIEVAIDVVA